jgi:hypothetical protein
MGPIIHAWCTKQLVSVIQYKCPSSLTYPTRALHRNATGCVCHRTKKVLFRLVDFHFQYFYGDVLSLLCVVRSDSFFQSSHCWRWTKHGNNKFFGSFQSMWTWMKILPRSLTHNIFGQGIYVGTDTTLLFGCKTRRRTIHTSTAVKLDATTSRPHCRHLLFSYSGMVKPSWRFASVNVNGRCIMYAMSLMHLSPRPMRCS